MSPTLRTLLVALLLAGYFLLAVTASRTKGPAFDEIVHVTAGYNAWINHDQRFDPGNGDFIKRWATLPLLRSRPTFPPLAGEDWQRANFFPVSRDFFFAAGNDPDKILFETRRMVALIGVALGVLVFLCSRQLFGDAGGLLSLTLFALCPHMLAHGALVSTDLTISAALLASTWFLWRLLHRVAWDNVLGSLIAFALLVVSKMSAVLIVPIAAILVVARFSRPGPRPRVRTLALLVAAHALVGWLAIWTIFEFKYLARAHPAAIELALLRTPGTDLDGPVQRLTEFCHRHRLLPEGYLMGMEELVGISQRRPSFMDGHWKIGGQAAFFPYAFWVKTPPALLCLLALGLAAWIARRRGDLAYEAIPFLALFVVYAAVAMRQQVNIGHRHILPLYPVLYILAGATALWLSTCRRAIVAVGSLLLGWYALDSLAVRPDYLAYFSPVAGGPSQGYRRLADSSLDWGQDLPALRRWRDAHPDAPLFLSYFGTGNPEHYGIVSHRLPAFPDWRDLRVFACTPGYYAISATLFQQLYTMTFGPWNRVYEAEYQATIRGLKLTEPTASDTAALAEALQAHPPAYWQEGYHRFEKLRFARLCAWLRGTGRLPDAQPGHSILIWKLSAADLHAALWGEPVELYEGSR